MSVLPVKIHTTGLTTVTCMNSNMQHIKQNGSSNKPMNRTNILYIIFIELFFFSKPLLPFGVIDVAYHFKFATP